MKLSDICIRFNLKKIHEKNILFFILSVNVFSQKNQQSELDSLKSVVTEIAREIFWNRPIRHIGWVTDHEKLYTKSEIATLNSMIDQFEKETTTEIAIVTLDSLKVSNDRFEELSLRIANHWRIGKLEKENGILIAISKVNRQIRIQNGNGIVKILSNEETKEIVDKFFIPEFKKEDYFEGTLQGVKELIQVLNNKNG